MPAQTPAARLVVALNKKLEKTPLTLPEKAEARRLLDRLRAAQTAARAAKILLSKAKRLRAQLDPAEEALLQAVVRVDPKMKTKQLLQAVARTAWKAILVAVRTAAEKAKVTAAYVAAAIKIGLAKAVGWLADHTYIEWVAKTVRSAVFLMERHVSTPHAG